jgi:hypothetical protein
MALKATRVTGPHSPPNCEWDQAATPLRIIADGARHPLLCGGLAVLVRARRRGATG